MKQEKNNSTAIKPIKEDKSSAKIQKTKAKHNIDMTITRKQHTKIIAKHICMRCHHFWHSVATSDNIIKPCDTIKLEKKLPWRQSRVSIQYLARMWQAPIKMCTIVATIVACAQLCILDPQNPGHHCFKAHTRTTEYRILYSFTVLLVQYSSIWIHFYT